MGERGHPSPTTEGEGMNRYVYCRLLTLGEMCVIRDLLYQYTLAERSCIYQNMVSLRNRGGEVQLEIVDILYWTLFQDSMRNGTLLN